ncbi:helix-turn-helix transcriptional regulator [Castellaniella sp.]|uniref:helix-turn-helix domain-containing protein n=1 Tax=Castellaniella sp. TaxID=1955812 RepID=UPI002AFE78F2|nr:helix-turn-helix transcriptional regulator [Castellaniella sp.]
MQKLSTTDQMAHVLIARRRALGLTQAEVASRLGISQNRLSELENQPAALTADRLLALAGVLGLELTLQERAQSAPAQDEW